MIAVATFAGAVLRLVGLGRAGLTHFDEGVYAFSGLWFTGDGFRSEVIAYAPPGFPLLVGLAYQVFGVTDVSVILVSTLAGILTVPAVAWVGWSAVGQGAGAATAVLSALSMAHVVFSRKGLTDAPFLLAWVLAVGTAIRFLERPGMWRAVTLGVLVGIAQNLKYYGWLAGAITILAALLGLLSNPETRSRNSVLRTFGFGAIAALVAELIYAPWFRYVEAHGGYASLLQHQRGYFLGPAAWWDDLRQQLAQVHALSGGPVWLMVTALLAGLAILVSRGRHDNQNGQSWTRGVMAGGLLVVLAVIPDLGWWAGLIGVPMLVFGKRPAERVLASWWLSQSILTPLYLPYARLWLPLHAFGWVLLGGVLAGLVRRVQYRAAEPSEFVSLRRIALGSALVLLVAIAHWGKERPQALALGDLLGPTDSVRTATAELAVSDPIRGVSDPNVSILARRPVAFYLGLGGRLPFRLTGSIDELKELSRDANPLVLIDGGLGPGQVGDLLDGQGNLASLGLVVRWRASVPLDPVTRLDVFPASAFGARVGRTVPIILLGK